MRLAKTDVVAGLAAPAARELARRLRITTRQADIEAFVAGGAGTLRELEAASYLRLDHLRSSPADPWWVNTVAGNALAQAGFGCPITRATADRLLGDVLDRAKQWNDDARPLVNIDEITVFGSYLDPAADALGDLDLAVVLSSRLPPYLDSEAHTAIVLRYAEASSRYFSTLVDQLCWPETEAIRALRGRSTAISVTTEDVRPLTDRSRIVYRRVASDIDAS